MAPPSPSLSRAHSARVCLLLAVGLALPALGAGAPPGWVDAQEADLVGGRAGLSPQAPARPEAEPPRTEAQASGEDDASAHRGEGAPLAEDEGWGGSGQWLGPGRNGLDLAVPAEHPFSEPVLFTVHMGVHLFTGAVGRLTRPGQQLGLELHLRPLPVAEVEVGYEAGRTPINPDLDEHGALWRHQLGALVKLGPVLEAQRARPYVGAGVGFGLISPGEGAPALFRAGTVWEVPLVLGMDWRLGRVTAGARATWRPLFGAPLLQSLPPGEPRGGMLGAELMVGAPF